MTTYSHRHTLSLRRAVYASLLVLASYAVTGCTAEPPMSAQAAGHTITAHIKGAGAKVDHQGESALLGSEFGKVAIERTRMRIEGEPWVQIAEGAPVTVKIDRGRVDLKAGKVSVSRSVTQ